MLNFRRNLLLMLTAATLGLGGMIRPAEGREPCGEQTLPILAPDHTVLGSAVVSNDSEFLYIDVHANTEDGWKIRRIHASIGPDYVPSMASQFDPHALAYVYEDEIKGNHRFKLPITEVSGTSECGVTLNIVIRLLAIETDLKSGRKSQPRRMATGTSRTFYEVCCTQYASKGCTRSPDSWMTQNHWPSPHDSDSSLCGESWRSILTAWPVGETWQELARSHIAANLNHAAGASLPLQVQIALIQSAELLEKGCFTISQGEKKKATSIATILKNYNIGLIGPGQCD